MKLNIGYATDPGPRDGPNQDTLLVVQPTNRPGDALIVVADGMGGARAGDFASQKAIAVLENALADPTLPKAAEAEERMRAAITKANRRVYEASLTEPDRRGMGCTVVAVLIIDGQYWIGSVGDSRAYLFNETASQQLTDDHTWVNARVQDGSLTREQAADHALRHVLNRAVGTHPDVEIDVWPAQPLHPGDRLLLCSDGLYDVLPDADIREIALDGTPQDAADRLLAAALDAPAHDNVTVIVLQAEES